MSRQNADESYLSHGIMNEIWEWLRAFIIAVALFFLIRTFLFAPFIVDGASMNPTLQHGERLIVTKAVYLWGEPQRGDIIVFHASPTKDYIKRVIGTPGDTVEMRRDMLYINGQPVEEPYLDMVKENLHASAQWLTDDIPPVHLKEDQYYVMGDNRRNSQDSRYIGPIDEEQIVGRADLVFWPFSSVRLLHTSQD